MYRGLAESQKILINWLLSLEGATGVPLSRTILSGFSQGGAMTLDVGLKLPVAALVAMSGYLHPDIVPPINNHLPATLIMHGKYDQVVPLQAALKARKTLESLGLPVEYHELDMGHEITLQVLDVFRNFVLSAVG